MPTKDGNHAYTDEEKAEIIAHVLVNVACGRFVSRVFREDATTRDGLKLPNQDTFYYWLFQDDQLPQSEGEKLSEKLARARMYGIEALIDETIDIADHTQFDTIRDEEGGERPHNEWISRSKVRIDTRFKLAQMMNPKKYGPKVDVTSGGEKIGAADAVQEARQRVQKLRDEERGVE